MKVTLNSQKILGRKYFLSQILHKQFSVFLVIIILLFVGFGCKYLKQEPDVESYKQELITAIRRADDVEIEAIRKLDKTILERAYKGEALLVEQKGVDNLIEQNIYADSILEDQEFETFKFLENGKKAEVRVVETWKSTYFNKEDDKCYSIVPKHKLPQTITLEKFDAIWFVVAIVHDLNSPEAKVESCEETPEEETTNVTRFEDTDAGISYEIPNDWKVEDKNGAKTLTSADEKLVIVRLSSEREKAEEDFKKLGKILENIIEKPEFAGEPEEYTIDGMRALKYTGTGAVKGKNINWGIDVIDSGKAVTILHIIDPENSRNSLRKIQSVPENLSPSFQEIKTFLNSILKL